MAARPPLPEPFQAFFAGLEEQEPAPSFARCFGCGRDHPAGLRVRCFRTADGVAAPIVVDRAHRGPPEVAHGGIVAAYLDEVLGAAAARVLGRMTITGELTVRYVAPAPLGTPLLGLGRVVATHARYVDAEGRLEELATRRLLATARGRFFPAPR